MSKFREERIFAFLYCPHEDWAEMHNKIQPDQSNQLHEFAGKSEGQCINPKKSFFPAFICIIIEQNASFFRDIFFHKFLKPQSDMCDL